MQDGTVVIMAGRHAVVGSVLQCMLSSFWILTPFAWASIKQPSVCHISQIQLLSCGPCDHAHGQV